MSLLQRLGRGWKYPIAPIQGDLPYEQGAEKIRQAIWIILDTEPGERVMRPVFGCGLRRYLMKPNTTATRALIQHDVQRALSTWEPRIALSAVRVDPGEDPSLVRINIEYTHLRDGSAGNLVYPFYLE
ncbi:MAG: baseplate assembly protein [Gemmatimonas sp.]|nr:baseplate assembly protein [Gemmatimonas sp.]